MIIISSKEPISVFNVFERCGIPYKIEDIEVGDFTNEEGTFVAERKGKEDQWNSMTDKRIYSQIARMDENYETNKYLFVEVGAFYDLSYEHPENKNWVYSIFGEAENWGINVREYLDLEDLARKLDALDKKLGSEKVRREKKVKMYNSTSAERGLAQFPGIGEKLSKEILKTCGNFMAVLGDLFTVQELLDTVKGVRKDGEILKNLMKELTRDHSEK